MAPVPAILREGETCWRRVRARRVRFLVDGEAFFGAVADALERAQRQVLLLGWDFHSSVRLRRSAARERPRELVALLDELARERRKLHAHVLGWDFAMFYALEREFLPLLQFGARTHRRVRFRLDSAHPLTASQHQKVVVVDDAVAFVGGFDLTSHRWDTREHRAEEPRRVTPTGESYQPFHDVQVAVDGEAAAALGELARERWRRATGRSLSAPQHAGDPWPETLEPHLREVDVGVARTMPSLGGHAEVREVEALYRASIGAARRSIYIENQYLTSASIAECLAARLREDAGPEIVIVGPRRNSGWLEETTMGALRDRTVRSLRQADRHDRLRVYYPDLPNLASDQMLNVHAKLMVVDDEFVRVGSANLSNRSMGLDTECDIGIEAGGRDDVRRAIARFRDDLLAEHLGVGPERVEQAIRASGSLVRGVERLCGGDRTLRPLELDAEDWAAETLEALGAVDPEHPAPLEELTERFVAAGEPPASRTRRSRIARFLLIAALLGGLAWLSQAMPLADGRVPEGLAALLGRLRSGASGLVLAAGLFALGSLAMIPPAVLTVAATLALGALTGAAVSLAGCLLATAAAHGIGRLLWRDTVRRLAGARLNALSLRLARSGVVSSALLRLAPVAPFTVVNLVAGASRVGLPSFLLGTVLGMLPAIGVLVLVTDRLAALAAEPVGRLAWAWVALAGAAALGILAALRRLARSAARR